MTKLYLIGNAHLDPVWLWRWQEGFSEVISTFRSALDRMKDFPDFKFTSACAVYYQWIEKTDPDMFAEIQQRVKEGRWSIVGGWFLQPDCNIPDGESFARHALISQRYFKEKFGITAKTGYNVDSFGHNASLPKILKKSGMDNYVFMRPMPHEGYTKDTLFKWESDDGSSVNAYRIPGRYNIDLTSLEEFGKIYEMSVKDGRDYMAFYGVGNHGGGATIKLINEMNKLDIDGMIYSTPDEYFAQVDKSGLPTIKDELQHHARGCYSAYSKVKKLNRQCEKNLIAAEKLCVMAKELTGAQYPKEKLKKAWKNVLFNHFHDIMGGCSIKKAYDDAAYLYGETMSITDQAINFAMQKISRNIDTLQGETLPGYKTPKNCHIWEHEVLGTPVVVFNPHAWAVKMPVSMNEVVTKVTNSKGDEIPFQRVRGGQTSFTQLGTPDIYYTSFIAEVPPLGYEVYRLFTEQKSEKTFENELKVTERGIENSRIKVEFDAMTGDICSFYDKQTDKYIINGRCSAVVVDETACDTWAHNVKGFGETVGMFSAPEFKITEEGAVNVALRVRTYFGKSVLEREYSLIPGSDKLKVNVKADFYEKHRVLKFAFPTGGEDIISKIPYGTIIRPQNTGEEPCGSWFAAGGFAVANDSKYAYDTEDGYVRLTALRTPIYADHGGPRDDSCENMDLGRSEFTYSVFPYRNNAQSEKAAEELNFPLFSIFDSFHGGKLPEKMSCLKCNNDDIVVSAVKESEDGNGNIIRIYEMNGKNTDVSVNLFGKEIKSKISHNEIKTFDDSGRELNLVEW